MKIIKSMNWNSIKLKRLERLKKLHNYNPASLKELNLNSKATKDAFPVQVNILKLKI